MSVISLMPEDFAVGSLPVGDMEVTDARFEVYDYDGKVVFNNDNQPPTCLRLEVKVLADGTEHVEMLSAGSSAHVVPSKDGMTMEGQADTVKSIYATTKLAMFITSLLAKGYPKSAMKDFKASSLVGLQFTAERPVAPDSDFAPAERTDGKAKKDRPRTFFAVKEIIKLPSDAKKAAGRASTSAAPKATGKPPAGATAASKATMGQKPTAADQGSADTNERAMTIVMDVLSKADGGSVPLPGLKVKGFSALRADDKETREEILKLITSADWLVENGFVVVDGIVSME